MNSSVPESLPAAAKFKERFTQALTCGDWNPDPSSLCCSGAAAPQSAQQGEQSTLKAPVR